MFIKKHKIVEYMAKNFGPHTSHVFEGIWETDGMCTKQHIKNMFAHLGLSPLEFKKMESQLKKRCS